jgi:hypothetical protein
MPFSGLSFGDFSASFDESLGRTVELKPEQEVRPAFATSFLVLLTFLSAAPRFRLHVLWYSVHQPLRAWHLLSFASSYSPFLPQAILGSSRTIPSYESLKSTSDLPHSPPSSPIARRFHPLSSVTQVMLDRIENIDLFSGTIDEAVERLMLCWMALEPIFGSEMETAHRLLGGLAQKGIAMLDSPELGEETMGMLDFALEGLMVCRIRPCFWRTTLIYYTLKSCEIRQSVLLGVPSAMSVSFFLLARPPHSLASNAVRQPTGREYLDR